MTCMPSCSTSDFSPSLTDKLCPGRPHPNLTDSFWHSNDAEQTATGLGGAAGTFFRGNSEFYQLYLLWRAEERNGQEQGCQCGRARGLAGEIVSLPFSLLMGSKLQRHLETGQ